MGRNAQLRTYNNATAIITGGASGIGRSLGKALAKRGSRVVLADIQLEMAQDVAKEIESSGGSATAAKLDVTDAQAVNTLLQNTFEEHGRVDYMFNNAGIAINGNFHDFTLTDWQRCIDINLLGVVHGVYAAYPIMAQQGFGHIINTASIAGIFPWPMNIAYTATKHAVVGLTTSLRAELAHSGITTSVFCPGPIQTAILEDGADSKRWAGNYTQEQLKKFYKSVKGMDSDLFAEKALKQIARNKLVIILPGGYKGLWWAYRLSSSLGISIATIIHQAVIKKLGQPVPVRR
jgi:NAD(P)-dependent dehydrogenase (short-subunit alcohol dehydrogenase family)